ncbi:hypothetical protein [Nocardioides sp. 1609]|uniref:hypothetical protein n=1 Tax=Nocardioides sp. 1609 TaxID=2508327 RepID=UPI0014317199|nr:hypothetical protein [Nocardioides sp. 1609]
MIRFPGAARAPFAALVLVAGLCLAGCGDDPTGVLAPAGEPSESVPRSAAPSDDGSSPTTAPVSPGPSETAPEVPAATGPRMKLTGLTFRVPQGWELASYNPLSRGAYNASGGPGVMSALCLTMVPGESFESTLAGSTEAMTTDGLKPERLEDVILDGTPAWVITGSKKGIALQVDVGGVIGNRNFKISFQYLTRPPRDVQTTIDSVLASVVLDDAE